MYTNADKMFAGYARGLLGMPGHAFVYEGSISPLVSAYTFADKLFASVNNLYAAYTFREFL
jgi:hypothetical protein